MEFELTLVVIGTDYIGNCKSNYHTIMTKTIPNFYEKDLKQNYILNLDLYTFSNNALCLDSFLVCCQLILYISNVAIISKPVSLSNIFRNADF